jgi:hypothetical protein
MSSGGTPHSSVARLDADAIVSHGMEICSWDALHDGRCAVSAFKGMHGAPTSRLTHSSGAEHGIAYRTRVPR